MVDLVLVVVTAHLPQVKLLHLRTGAGAERGQAGGGSACALGRTRMLLYYNVRVCTSSVNNANTLKSVTIRK